jgi:hypothetical protein
VVIRRERQKQKARPVGRALAEKFYLYPEYQIGWGKVDMGGTFIFGLFR